MEKRAVLKNYGLLGAMLAAMLTGGVTGWLWPAAAGTLRPAAAAGQNARPQPRPRQGGGGARRRRRRLRRGRGFALGRNSGVFAARGGDQNRQQQGGAALQLHDDSSLIVLQALID